MTPCEQLSGITDPVFPQQRHLGERHGKLVRKGLSAKLTRSNYRC